MGIWLKRNNYPDVNRVFDSPENDMEGLDKFETPAEMKEQHMKGRVIQCQQGRN